MQKYSGRHFDFNRYLAKSERVGRALNMGDRYRTCCNCWHIRAGTMALGLIELIAVSLILHSVIRQLRWKSIEQAVCTQKKWRECLNFHNFNLTMAGDYIIAIILFSIGICILLLFYGVLTRRPRFLLPHLIVQAICLLFSFGYFILYAWTYFYGDLHTGQKAFMLENFVERMWLSAIILIFAIFQCYLFFSVIKCSLYLNKLNLEQEHRFMQFEEVSNRVKLAKENGLWRSTSWGGSFQQYRGQYERKPTKKFDEKKSANNRVQWNLEENLEKSIPCEIDFTNTVDEIEFPAKRPNNVFSSILSSSTESNTAICRGSSRRASGSSTSRARHSRDSESSNNSIRRQNRQNSSGDSPPSPVTKKVSHDSTPLSTSAVIYTKIGAPQKPLPQAVVRLKPTKFSTFDSADMCQYPNGGVTRKSQKRERHSSHGSLREGRRPISGNASNRRSQKLSNENHESTTSRQATIPQVKKVFITSPALQNQVQAQIQVQSQIQAQT